MADPLVQIRNDLQGILRKILAGETDEVRLVNEIDELLTGIAAAQEPPIIAFVLDFCSHLVKQVLSDSLAFRASMLAELAFRLNHWIGLRAHTLTAFCAERLMRLRDYEKALSLLDRDLQGWPRNGTAEYRVIEALRARCLEYLARFADADRCVTDYELAYQPLPSDHVSIEMLLTGALAASESSNPRTSERRASLAVLIYERIRPLDCPAIPLAEVLFPPLSAARLHAIHGQVISQSGDILRAVEEFQRGRHEAQKEGDARGAAICLSEIGITWERAAERERGALLLGEAAREAEACGETEMAARWRGMEVVDPHGRRSLHGFDGLSFVGARVRAAEGRPDEEAEAIVKNIIIGARGTNPRLESVARNALAGLYALRAHFNQAFSQLKVAIQTADSINDPWTGMRFRANLANISFRAGRFAEAEEAAREALDRAVTHASKAAASEVRQAAAVAVMNASEVLFLLWSVEMITSAGEVRPPNPDRVVAIAQQVRSRNFDRWLALTNLAQHHPAEQPHQMVHNLIEAEIAVEAAAQAGESLSAPLQAVDRASRDLASGYPTLWQKRFLGGKSPGLQEAINCLTESDIVLDLNPVQSGLVCIAAGRKRRAECFEIPWGRVARVKWSERWRCVSEGPGYRSSSRRARMPASSLKAGPCEPEIEQQSKAALADLDEHFLEPLYGHIGAGPTRIICATHSELFGIPLWSLSRVIPDLVLSVVPSIASISLLATRPVSRGTRCVKIGDATGTLAMVPRELAALSSFEWIEPERAKLSRELSGARRVHFAGHGEFLEANPYSSGIVIRGAVCRPYAVPDADERCVRLTLQGLVHDWHVSDCDLVVLSACSTGIPRSHGASEFTSVSTALLLAGARNVIAASWPADDVATMLLMWKFYDALNHHSSPARALAAARSSLQMMGRSQALTLVKEDHLLPSGPRPFSSSVFTDTFLHFGVD